jgi:hypothetical protein
MLIAAYLVQKTISLAATAAVLGAIAALLVGSASAEERAATGLNVKSAAVAESEAIVLSDAPYQTLVQLNCSASACQADLPAVETKRRLVIQFISCQADTSAPNGILDFVAFVRNSSNTIAGHFVAPIFQSAIGTRAIASQPILLTVNPSRFLRLRAEAETGDVVAAVCGVSGLMQRLK